MKQLISLFLAGITAVLLGLSTAAAGLGEIHTIHDVVHPNGKDAVIVTEITATTDAQGQLALPKSEKAQLMEAVALKGRIETPPTEKENGAMSYYVVTFAEKEQEVALRLTLSQADVYVLGKAKTKNTAPGNMKALKYGITNTAPVEIEDYTLHLAVPQDYELSAIVGYDPEEDFSIIEQHGYRFGYQGFGGLKPGEKTSMTLNLQERSGALAIGSWIVTVLVSAFFLYKNRDMLKTARELGKAKKTEKSHAAV